jgi:hypothetical protein
MVPTQLCYEGGEVLWGFSISEDSDRHADFKPSLDTAQKNDGVSLLAIEYPDPRALPPSYNRRPKAVQLT